MPKTPRKKPQKPRLRRTKYEGLLREYAETILDRATENPNWGYVYLNALKAAEDCRRYDHSRKQAGAGNGPAVPVYPNGADILRAINGQC